MKAAATFFCYFLGVWLGLLLFGHPDSLKRMQPNGGFAEWEDQTNQPIKSYSKIYSAKRTFLLGNQRTTTTTKTPKLTESSAHMLASLTESVISDVTKVQSTNLEQLNHQQPTTTRDGVTTISTIPTADSPGRVQETNLQIARAQTRSSRGDHAGPT